MNEDQLATHLETQLSISNSYAAPSSLANKYPFPTHPHTGALVKLYTSASEDVISPKTTEIIEFVGVLDYAYFPNASTEESQGNSTELIKTLHAIYQLPRRSESGRDVNTTERDEDRREMIAYIAQAIGGDRLAAEFLLLALYGKM